VQVVFTFRIHPFIPVFIGGDSINVRQYRRGNLKWTIQRNWLHRITKTQDEDKQNTKTKHNMCWTPPYTRRRQTKQKTQHNMCWTPPYTRRRQTKQKTQHNTKTKHNMCWTPPYTRHKTKFSPSEYIRSFPFLLGVVRVAQFFVYCVAICRPLFVCHFFLFVIELFVILRFIAFDYHLVF
jgi:hypothetical protein